MNLSHKTKIYPNNKQAAYFCRACGIRRFAYNWALAQSRKLYEDGVKTSGYDLVKRFNSIKHDQFPWTSEVTKWAPQKSIQDAFDALKRWWKGVSKAPRFKKKNKSRDSFYVGGTNFTIKGRHLRIDKCGQMRMAQEIRFPGKIKFITVSREADEWFVSSAVDLDDSYQYPHECETQDSVGVDVGVSRLVALSNGQYLENPRYLLKAEKRLKRLQRKLARKQKGSNNYNRAKLRLQRAHVKLKRVRRDLINKITTYLVRRFRIIGIEDLNVTGMVKNHKLAKHISDVSFYEYRRQLEYKSKLSHSEVVVVSRWFPSSKTCCRCGHKFVDLKLSDRKLKCPGCGLKINRDRNAAVNLEKEALRLYRQQPEATGCRKRSNKTDNVVTTHQQDQRRRKSSNALTGRLAV